MKIIILSMKNKQKKQFRYSKLNSSILQFAKIRNSEKSYGVYMKWAYNNLDIALFIWSSQQSQ